jgi:hypothetical protein
MANILFMAVLPAGRHGEDRLDLLIAQLAARVVDKHIVERGVLHAE